MATPAASNPGGSAANRDDGTTTIGSTVVGSGQSYSGSTAQENAAIASEFQTFGDFTPAFGPGFQTTADYINNYLNTVTRANIPPPSPNAWEMSIGAAKFMVPPVNIQVSRGFQTGALTGGAIRQLTPPKFNSGHSETLIGVTLYFPNQDSIWGYDADTLTIDFANDSEEVVDTYLSSLRGLITAFRYTPILPISNQYLNSTFGISSVALKTITVSTESDSGSQTPFPFCITVNLELLAFDHTSYLPMVTQLSDAVDWGKYRIYMGRCAYIMETAANKQFSTIDMQGAFNPNTPVAGGSAGNRNDGVTTSGSTYIGSGQTAPADNTSSTSVIPNANPNELIGVNDPNSANYDPTSSGISKVTFDTVANLADSTDIQFYYPPKDPVGQVPDYLTLDNFAPTNPNNTTQDNSSWWNILTGSLGLSQGSYGTWSQVSQFLGDPRIQTQYSILKNWLKFNTLIQSDPYGSSSQGAWVQYAVRGMTGAAADTATTQAQQAWLVYVYNSYFSDPVLQEIYNAQAYLRGQRLIDEWEVPMVQLPIDTTRVIVTSITAQSINNFARLPLTMRDTPVYQHIGGLGTKIEVNLYVTGETDLTNLRLMFDTISNLSRLEHGHAVLGFLGIKNVIVALCGTKYVIPSSFDVQTINGMPHTYAVKMVFADFDIFQQKREMLSSEQQTDLIQQFGKANPFLRLKQNWSAFNSYPDFPLSVIDPNTQDVVGQLDPDFYFKSFSTVDADLATLPNHSQDGADGSANYAMVHHIGTYSDVGSSGSRDSYSIGLNDGYWDLRTNDSVHIGGLTYNEPHNGNTHDIPLVKGLTPASGHLMPNFDTKADGSQSTTGLVDANFKLMMQDTAYRDQSGRMVRAFPTYMLWLINEGGLFAGQQLFDNFYGLQSVLDFSFVDNEDVMGGTLVIRVSNLYSRLSTTYSQEIDPNLLPGIATLINPTTNAIRNLTSGETNTVVQLDTVNVQPGVRLHLRAGYGSNPNLLETIFNGTVTSVEVGDVMTITAQTDAIEFGAVVNNTNTSGSSGDIDGSMSSGLWFSTPRDLIVRLMTMAASPSKEAIANAAAGMVYSENRFGIRHFGHILYDAMTPTENANQQAREGFMSSNGAKTIQDAQSTLSNLGSSAVSVLTNPLQDITDPVTGVASASTTAASNAPDLVGLLNDLWVNFSATRDLEIFMRNVYPGNGTGIGQYTGGDLGDGGTATAFTPTGIDDTGAVNAVNAQGETVNNSGQVIGLAQPDAAQILGQSTAIQNQAPQGTQSSTGGGIINDVGSWFSGGLSDVHVGWFNPEGFMAKLLSVEGITNPNGNVDEGPGAGLGGTLGQYSGPFAEVSFRAGTYMKTVWDMFLICAALLPNYVIAVRPWENRSTLFYGKPHWAYTSGVMPVTTGRTAGTSGQSTPDKVLQALQDDITKAFNESNTQSSPSLYQQLTTISSNEWNKILAGGTTSANPTGTATSSTQATSSAGGATTTPTPATNTAKVSNVDTSSVSSSLSAQDKAFITQMAPYAKYAASQTGWDGNLILAQWACETGWGTSSAWTQRFNPAGLNITSDAVSGDSYGSVQGGVKAYIDFINGDTAGYYKAVKSASTPAAAAVALGNSPWAGGHYNNGNGPGSTLLNIMVLIGNAADSSQTVSASDVSGSVILDSTSSAPPPWLAEAQASGLSYEAYSAEYGGSTPGVPVDFTGTIAGSTEIDVLGDAAKRLYSSFRSDADANQIWQDFIEYFSTAQDSSGTSIQDYFNLAYPTPGTAGTTAASAIAAGAQNLTAQNTSASAIIAGGSAANRNDGVTNTTSPFIGSGQSTDPLASQPSSNQQAQTSFEAIVADFQQFMWTNAYHRGWIVLTADAVVDNSLGSIITSVLDPSGTIGSALGVDPLGSIDSSITTGINDVANAASSLWDSVFGGGGNYTPPQYNWTFAAAAGLFEVYIKQGNAAAINYMQENNQAGFSQTNPLTRLFEDATRTTTRGITQAADFVGSTASAIGSVAGSIIDTLKLSLNVLSGGANLALYAGGQSNLLNGVYNDSIYYAEGSPGSLTWLCDNAFTREFGEPVVEIREPFQRLHYLNSFQHIIANGIVENSDQVATVVTCTTDGQHPITASFDKGAPAYRQVEITVDDGLQWQAPAGILNSITHPIQEIRSFLTHFNNGDDATNADRVARWHLKENLKNIYTGELIILGDAQIRPFDLVYLYDSYEKMYGLFEVEQVVHQFSPETGFITSITPNAIVIINDPAKWQFGSILQRQGAAQAIRNSVRNTLSASQSGQSLNGTTDSQTINDYANQMGTDLLGTTQYTGGIGAVVKDLGGAAGMGGLMTHPSAQDTAAGVQTAASAAADGIASSSPLGAGQVAVGNAASNLFFGENLSDLASTALTWPVFSWLRDNLFDAHACYIQYLNRNGSPMDAGLSYNFGTAVGQANVISFFGDAFALPVNFGGSTTITTDQLLTNIGWQAKDVISTYNGISQFQNYTMQQVLQLSGQNGPPIGTPPLVQAVNITSLVDNITFTIDSAVSGTNGAQKVQLAYISGSPNINGTEPNSQAMSGFNNDGINYIQNILNNIQEQYGNTQVVLRIDPTNPYSSANQDVLVATVFYQLPSSLTASSSERQTTLEGYANNYPGITWNDYLADGNPYTLNQEMLSQGLATINTAAFSGTATASQVPVSGQSSSSALGSSGAAAIGTSISSLGG